MIIGQVITAGGSEPVVFYSPWFRRGGNRGYMTCNLIASANVKNFKIYVETKNSEDSDKDTNATTWLGTISTSSSETAWLAGASVDSSSQGFLELVRFRYELSANPSTEAFAHFRMLQPQWFTN